MAKSSFKVGDRVKWIFKNRMLETSFEVSGKITALKMSTYGSCAHKMGATVEVKKGTKYHKVTGRLKTNVAVSSLKLA